LEHVEDVETWVIRMQDPPRGQVRKPSPEVVAEEDKSFQTFFAEFQQGA
jgi:hypothetical protein